MPEREADEWERVAGHVGDVHWPVARGLRFDSAALLCVPRGGERASHSMIMIQTDCGRPATSGRPAQRDPLQGAHGIPAAAAAAAWLANNSARLRPDALLSLVLSPPSVVLKGSVQMKPRSEEKGVALGLRTASLSSARLVCCPPLPTRERNARPRVAARRGPAARCRLHDRNGGQPLVGGANRAVAPRRSLPCLRASRRQSRLRRSGCHLAAEAPAADRRTTDGPGRTP